MAQENVKTIHLLAKTSFHSSKVISLGGSGTVITDGFMIPVRDQNSSDHLDFAVFEWDFTSSMQSGLDLTSVTVQKVELEFYFRKADEPDLVGKLDFVELTNQPSTRSGADLWNDVDGASTTYLSNTTQGDPKTIVRVTLGSDNSKSASTRLDTAIENNTFFAVGIKRNASETGNGYIEVGGISMLRGAGTEWRVAASDEVQCPPVLIFTYRKAGETHVEHSMRYTTSDPTSTQSTPSNSIGGYIATNEVFTRSQIGDFVSSTQTVIKTSENAASVLKKGLVQIGPEIASYTGIDTGDRQLIGVTRGLVPAAFPSSIDPFAEHIHYLDVAQLFDNRPTTGLEQYRCVAIRQTTDNTATDVKLVLIQDDTNDVQIDLGIEVPSFDRHTGTLATSVIAGAKLLTSTTTGGRGVVGFASGFFEGGHLVIGTTYEGIIDSYDDTGGTGEFILDTAFPTGGFSGGTSFRINPAPSQSISNDRVAPVENSARFLGFFGAGGSKDISFASLRENLGTMEQFDAFYLWIKRTLKKNVKASSDTAAIVIVYFS